MGVYILSAQAQLKGRPKDTAKYQVKNCACEDACRAGQGVSYRISKLFSRARANCRYPSSPEDKPPLRGLRTATNVSHQPQATGTTGTDPTRPP